MPVKYGRSFHLPSSPGTTDDDKTMHDISELESCQEVVITEKMDGENTTILSTGCHPRSPDARHHPSRDWMKAFAAGISPYLANDERIVGEYLFARHSIAYSSLPSYFMGFCWIVDGVIQSWDDTAARFTELGICIVPQLFRGPYSPETMSRIVTKMNFGIQEGFVVRTTDSFRESQMSSKLAKYVRSGHDQSDIHWSKAPIVPNRLR